MYPSQRNVGWEKNPSKNANETIEMLIIKVILSVLRNIDYKMI